MHDDNDIAALLKAHKTPPASDEFFERALLRASRAGNRQQRNRWVLTGFGSAVAAGLVLWLLGGLFMTMPMTPTNAPEMPAVVMTLEEPRTVNLVFAANEALPDATLTVSLPDGVELSGFPGQREITWQTSLNAGKNLLPLTLIATSAVDGVVLATLQHDNRDRTFRLRVAIG